MHGILLNKVRAWAIASRGSFPIRRVSEAERGPVSLILWNQDAEQSSLSRVAWGQLKSINRAVEKLVRAYHQVQ